MSRAESPADRSASAPPKSQAGAPKPRRSDGFKPVALPALAAAVHALKAASRRPKRPAPRHELPAILRDETAFS